MYHNVYFQTDMLTTSYVIRALVRARELVEEGNLTVSVRMNRMLMDDNLSVKDYLALTDSLIQAELSAFVTHDDPHSLEVGRSVGSACQPPQACTRARLTELAYWDAKSRIEQILADAGHDPQLDMITARVHKEGYRPYAGESWLKVDWTLVMSARLWPASSD